MKRIIIGVFLLIILISVSPVMGAEQRPKVLVLHSYHQGLEWSDSISNGIIEAFGTKENYELQFEYLDLKRNHGTTYYDQLIDLFVQKSRDIEYAGVVVADNAALSFVQDYGEMLYGDIPVVFCGINNFSDELIANDHMTGIAETVDHRDNVELMMALHPKAKEILIINDDTLTGMSILKELEPVLEDYKDQIQFNILETFNFDTLQEELAKLDEETPIYLLVVNRDSEGRFVSYYDGINLVYQNTENPIYGAWDFYLGKGIIGGKITSGYDHGYQAGKMMLSILNGQDPTTMPVVTEHFNTYQFDYIELEKHGIPQSSLPEYSLVMNKPLSHFQTYRNHYIGASVLILCLAGVYIMYGFNRKWEKLKLENLLYRKYTSMQSKDASLDKQAMLDSLTQVYNRRSIIKKLGHAIKVSKMTQKELSLIMFDIDNFGAVNDTFGSKVGDQVLNTIVTCVQEVLSQDALLGRFGGDEFLVVLPGTSVEESCEIAEEMCDRVSKCHHDGVPFRVTLSCGVLVVDPDKALMDVVDHVDALMMDSKRQGRNCIGS